MEKVKHYKLDPSPKQLTYLVWNYNFVFLVFPVFCFWFQFESVLLVSVFDFSFSFPRVPHLELPVLFWSFSPWFVSGAFTSSLCSVFVCLTCVTKMWQNNFSLNYVRRRRKMKLFSLQMTLNYFWKTPLDVTGLFSKSKVSFCSVFWSLMLY